MDLEHELISLRDRAWTTAGARYNAARRLRTRARFSLLAIALTSAIGVAVPLLLDTDGSRINGSAVSAYAALLSLFILVIAIIEGASAHEARADALFRNAERLNAFRLKLNLLLTDVSSLSLADLKSVTEEYSGILETCSVNHEVVDYELVRVMCPKDFGIADSFFRRVCARIGFYLYSTWWLAVIVLCAISGLVVVLRLPVS